MGWFEGKAYVDAKGRTYKVVPSSRGSGDETVYRARSYRPDKAGAYSVPSLPWRMTAEEAQRDLDALAAKKGWMPHEAGV